METNRKNKLILGGCLLQSRTCYGLLFVVTASSTALPVAHCRLSWLCFYLPSGIGPIQPYLTGTVAAGHDKFAQVSCVACFSRPPPRT